MSDSLRFPEAGKTYVPRMDDSNAVSIHAWHCPHCDTLNGISVPVSVPLSEPLPVTCEGCGVHATYQRPAFEVNRYIQYIQESKP